MRINDLVGETTEYDKKLKVELRKPKSWCKSISAFANTLGGALIFGVSDENEIIGLDNPVKDAEKISEIIKTKLNPIPEFKMSFRKVEDNILIILEVFKGDETPYYYYNDGSLEAYIRIGNESVKASPTELQRLVLRGRNKSYDSQKSMYKIRDYSFSKLRERYKKWTGYSFDEKNLISFGLADEEGYLTIAGSLIVDDSPVHHSRLFCTRWNGLNKSSGVLDALDEAEYEGSVIMPNLNYCDKKEDSLNDQNRTDDTINVQKGADDIINDTINIQKGAGDIINDQDGTNHKINTQDGTDNIINHQSHVKDEIELTMEEIKILEIMKNKPDITIKQLTVILSGISNRTITRNIVILKKKRLLERVGSRKKGYWKVKR